MKGTPSQGKHGRIRHKRQCRRCGKQSLNKKGCSQCNFKKTAKLRTYAWRRQKN